MFILYSLLSLSLLAVGAPQPTTSSNAVCLDLQRLAKDGLLTMNHPEPTGYALPLLLAWEGDGVWALQMTEDNWEAYNALPVTTDEDEDLRQIKNFEGAVWIAEPKDHPLLAMDYENEKRS